MAPATKWLNFLRQYGPIARADNMYDETIQRSARRSDVQPILFQHPALNDVATSFDRTTADPISVILTGTAGDGKTHLCRNVWDLLGGSKELWESDDPYISMAFNYPKDRKAWPSTGPGETPDLYRLVTIHFIRDLSGWAPQQGLEWPPGKEKLLQQFCKSLFDPEFNEIFLIAANDGQLVESWRRLSDTPDVVRARQLFEDLLVEDRQQEAGVRLRMFNLSRWSSAELFDCAYEAFINHSGWKQCYEGVPDENEAFGPRCPIRHNYELLKTPLVAGRLRALIELCDHNGLHLPIRQILLLLSNAVLGHPDCKDHLMRPRDIPDIIARGTVSRASLYNNILGGNLSSNRRESITVFDYFERFQIGYETCNRIDNILIYGDGDERLGAHFNALIRDDSFYGADKWYYDSRSRYIEGLDDDPGGTSEFLNLLVTQRRGLFFKIPDELVKELKLWDLTVFRFAGEYLIDVLGVLRDGHSVRRPILNRIVKGLNRIFTGMLLNTERDLLLATSGNYSQAKISRVLVDSLSVDPRHGEKISICLNGSHHAAVHVSLAKDFVESLDLNLVRYEFLSRVATEGALPASFSKECYEDMLAFKSRLLAAHDQRRNSAGFERDQNQLGLRLLNVSEQGMPEERFVEVVL
jgi:hypothetical protein